MLQDNDKEKQLNAQIWKFLHQRCKWWPTWACPNLYGIISPAYKFGADITESLKAFDDTLLSLWKRLSFAWGCGKRLVRLPLFPGPHVDDQKEKSERRPTLTYRWCWWDKHCERDQGSRTKATLLRQLRTCYNRPHRHRPDTSLCHHSQKPVMSQSHLWRTVCIIWLITHFLQLI